MGEQRVNESPVVLRRFLWLTDAEEAACLLRGYGVECFVADMAFLSWYPYLSSALGGVRLWVRRSEFSDAAEILRWAYQKGEDRCPDCESGNVSTGERRGWGMLALCGWCLIPLHPLKRRRWCNDCWLEWRARNGGHAASTNLGAKVWFTLLILRVALLFSRGI